MDRLEKITKSRETSEEQWLDQPMPLEADVKSDRDVKSRKWQSWKGITVKHDHSSLHLPSEPTVCGGDGTAKAGEGTAATSPIWRHRAHSDRPCGHDR